MRILQINSTVNTGSTGRIAEEIGQVLMAHGHESFIAYGRGNINSLMSRGKWSKEVIMVALGQADISPGIRAEQLAIGQFAALAEALPR